MKRKLLLLDLGTLLLLGAYSIAGWRMLRGAGAYRIGTTLGTVLSRSCPFTTLAALVLLAATFAALLIWLRKRRKAKSAEPLEGAALQAEKGGLAQPEPETERKIQPARGNPGPEAAAPMEEAAGAQEETVPMTEDAAMAETVPMTEDAAMAETVPMGAEASASPGPASASDEAAAAAQPEAARCANCAAALKPGQRFCTRCGTPVKGGAAS